MPDSEPRIKVYQVIGWDRFFEGAKSKSYNNKSSCMMPCKHGLGYRRLISEKDGPAMFGAWCSMIQTISRQPSPRRGYLTDNGRSTGKAYTPEDLELLTNIPSCLFERMLEICSSQTVGWLSITYVKDTTRIPQGYHEDTIGIPRYPSNYNLDSNSNSSTPTEYMESSTPTPYTDIVAFFNSLESPFPKVTKLTDTRKRHLKSRFNDHGLDSIKQVFTMASKSPFLTGENERGWMADFDWLIKPSNFQKVIEGKYNKKSRREELAKDF